MKLCVLNGSPKGARSVTMQYIAFLEKKFPHHQFDIIHVSLQCRKMEHDEDFFSQVLSVIQRSDAVLWAFPLYYLLVHSQYKRFIELIFERGKEAVFKNKYAAALSTSIHFFDNTAHDYIRSVCDDLGMNYVDFYPARMDDIMKKENHPALVGFFKRIERHVSGSIPSSPAYGPVMNKGDYVFKAPSFLGEKLTAKKVVIAGVLEAGRPNVEKMANYLSAHFEAAEMINLSDIKTGPCLGCLKCGFDNVCAYDGKDEYIPMLKNKILAADILIFALAMHDRYFSHVWQRYLERNFVNTHQPVLTGKQVAYLISGPLSQNHTAREILQAYTENMKGNFAGIVTDESADAEKIAREIDALAVDMDALSRDHAIRPATFLGVGGLKIFRDDIYEGLRFVFQGDHRYYKQHGLYDFPQKKYMKRLVTSMMVLLTRIPFLRKRIRTELSEGMLRPFRKVLDRA